MSYVIRALVAKQNTFAHIKALSDFVTIAQLNQGFELLLDDHRLMSALKVEDIHVQVDNKMSINKGVLAVIRQLSQSTPIAYMSADYFGGNGHQWAQLWRDGQVVLAPKTNSAEVGYKNRIAPEKRPINRVLRTLGVVRGKTVDEFAAIGLDKHRHMEDWFKANTPHDKTAYNPDHYE